MSIEAVLALVLFTSSAISTNLGAPLVGCSEVDCPTATNSTSADCRVVDRSFSAIGLASFNVSLDNDENHTFTWTEGLEAYDDVNPSVGYDRVYEKNFYLGSPQGFDLPSSGSSPGEFRACALFFTQTTDMVSFEGDNIETSVGTCTDAFNANCVNAVVAQARDLVASLGRSSSADVCERLLSEFKDNLASQCSQFTTGDSWQGLEVRGEHILLLQRAIHSSLCTTCVTCRIGGERKRLALT